MKKITNLDRLHYAFDNFMAKGTPSLIGGLAAISGLFILAMAILVQVGRIQPGGEAPQWNLPEAIWGVLMRTMDTGTVGADEGWLFRLVMLFVTFGGIFVISTLIGLIGSGIEAKLQELRKGRSRVIEKDHVVILGWSFQIFTLLSELILANANRKDACVVILSEVDKVEMEDTIVAWLGTKHKTRIVCRTGSPSDMGALELVNIEQARTIIVLNPPSELGDINLIKTLLAITNIPKPAPYHIVAQIQDAKTRSLIPLVGGDQVETLMTNDLISRIIVQTLRQSGLSAVYMDLFDFEGNEIYFVRESQVVGQTYGDILQMYEESVIIGFRTGPNQIMLNPPRDLCLPQGGELIAIAEDDDTTRLTGSKPEVQGDLIVEAPDLTVHAEHTLILNWNGRIHNTIQELDRYVAPGSTVSVVALKDEGGSLIREACPSLNHETVNFYYGDPTERQTLESVKATNFDHILVLCNDEVPPEQADAQTLVTLLQLRELMAHRPKPVITEMLDARNQVLAEAAKPDDFVISEQIISRLLAQVGEQKMLNQVFSYLLSTEGAEIYLKPVTNYVALGQPVNFYTVVEAALRQGQTAIGYRLKADANNRAKGYGVTLNPKKSNLITFTEADRIVVVAEQ